MKYTLFAFQLHESQLTDSLRNNGVTEVGAIIDRTKTNRVDICCGVYVFETQKGWRDMHLLRTFLVSMKKPFVELPFELALAGFFPDDVSEELRKLTEKGGTEFSLLNLNRL